MCIWWRGRRAANGSGNVVLTNGHIVNRWQYELATAPKILDVAQDLLGETPDVPIEPFLADRFEDQ